MTEERFIKSNIKIIEELLLAEKEYKESEEKYRKLRERLCKKLIKFNLSNIKIPSMNIRIQINGGKYSDGKINRSKLESKYPEAYRDCLEFSKHCPKEYISVYSINNKLKKGVNLNEVLK